MTLVTTFININKNTDIKRHYKNYDYYLKIICSANIISRLVLRSHVL